MHKRELNVRMWFSVVGILALSLMSCQTSDFRYETSRYETADGFVNGYFIPGGVKSASTLVIYVDGSGLLSVLGKYDDGRLTYETFVHSLRKYLPADQDIYAPDKINFEPGRAYRATDQRVMDPYTFADRVDAMVVAIDGFLSNHEYSRVVLAGYSEGAIILPRIYNSLSTRSRLSQLVLISHGGLSQYECFKVLRDSSLSFGYKASLSDLDEQVARIEAQPTAKDQRFLGWPYARWSGFMKYRPIDDLVTVDIPIDLFHGSNDTSAPVESSEYVIKEFEGLGKSNAVLHRYAGYDHLYNGDYGFLAREVAACLRQPHTARVK
jgi:hypothetical protein